MEHQTPAYPSSSPPLPLFLSSQICHSSGSVAPRAHDGASLQLVSQTSHLTLSPPEGEARSAPRVENVAGNSSLLEQPLEESCPLTQTPPAADAQLASHMTVPGAAMAQHTPGVALDVYDDKMTLSCITDSSETVESSVVELGPNCLPCSQSSRRRTTAVVSLPDLPNEVLLYILGFLEVCDLLATSRTSRQLRALSLAPILHALRLRRTRAILPPLLYSPSRPSLADLIARSIFLTHTTVVSRKLARSLVAIRLARRLAVRPSPEVLVERCVLLPECIPGRDGPGKVAPAIVAKKRAVEKERVKDGLRRWVGAVWERRVRERAEGIRRWEERVGVGRVWKLRRFWERVGRGEIQTN